MANRILVLSASVGAGHMRAAQAVELALKQLAPQATIRNTDVLTLSNTAFRRMYGTAYLDLVNKAPHMLGLLYDLMDKPRRPKSRRDGRRPSIPRALGHSDRADPRHRHSHPSSFRAREIVRCNAKVARPGLRSPDHPATGRRLRRRADRKTLRSDSLRPDADRAGR